MINLKIICDGMTQIMAFNSLFCIQNYFMEHGQAPNLVHNSALLTETVPPSAA